MSKLLFSLCTCFDGELPKVVDTLDCSLSSPEKMELRYITELKMMGLGSSQRCSSQRILCTLELIIWDVSNCQADNSYVTSEPSLHRCLDSDSLLYHPPLNVVDGEISSNRMLITACIVVTPS